MAYGLARKRMEAAASQSKQQFDKKARAFPLVPGERVWLRDRNRHGRGKLCTWWNPEPYVILEQVGDTGVVYRVQPERGGRTQTIHRNSLKVCTAPPAETPLPAATPSTETEKITPPLIFGFCPDMVAVPPANMEAEVALRRSTRATLGQTPVRFRD